jgi:DNA-binding HxlR family transcriptional regulator
VTSTRTDEKVGHAPACNRPPYTPETAARGVEAALAVITGRWKMLILFHLFGGRILRFSELDKAIPGVSQKMLTQQLRELEHDGLVHRTVHPEVPPRVEYGLTEPGQALCPALDALLKWAEQRDATLAASPPAREDQP